MSKYYKAEDVINAIEDKIAEYIPTLYGRYAEIPLELRMAIEHLPTIDIVRCKDCKHNPKRTNDFAYGRCVCCCEDDWYGYVPDDDFFCGHGERIEK